MDCVGKWVLGFVFGVILIFEVCTNSKFVFGFPVGKFLFFWNESFCLICALFVPCFCFGCPRTCRQVLHNLLDGIKSLFDEFQVVLQFFIIGQG